MSQTPNSPSGNERRDARVLIVGGGAFQIDVIRSARRLVREVWVVDRDPNAPGMALADRAEPIDFAKAELVEEFVRTYGFDAVTTAASDVAVPAVARCVELLGTRGNDTETVLRCRDKLETVSTLKRSGLRAPLTRLVTNIEAARREIAAIGGYPAVIKPRFGAGGRGVTIVKQESQLQMAIEKVQRYLGADNGFLVQELIGGHSVGVEAFMWEGSLAAGFCLSDQYTEGFVSPVGHGRPDDLDDVARKRVLRAAEMYCKALDIKDGPINFDLRDTADGVCLVEANPRLGGNSITPLIRASCGADLTDATVLAALGEDPTGCLHARNESVAYATRMIVVRGWGPRVVIRQSGERWQHNPDVVELDVITAKGNRVAFFVDDWALLGKCLVRGRSGEEAIDLARRVANDMQSCVTLLPPRF